MLNNKGIKIVVSHKWRCVTSHIMEWGFLKCKTFYRSECRWNPYKNVSSLFITLWNADPGSTHAKLNPNKDSLDKICLAYKIYLFRHPSDLFVLNSPFLVFTLFSSRVVIAIVLLKHCELFAASPKITQEKHCFNHK